MTFFTPGIVRVSNLNFPLGCVCVYMCEFDGSRMEVDAGLSTDGCWVREDAVQMARWAKYEHALTHLHTLCMNMKC